MVIVGLGVQGKKRAGLLKSVALKTVDPYAVQADYSHIEAVPVNSYQSALVCVPDHAKYKILKYLASHRKHILVEKPLLLDDLDQITELNQLVKQNKIVLYTAYNHRFEPHIVRMKELIDSKALGQIYSCRLFYGNGTARLVRNSEWRDTGLGVIGDLGSHLLDMIDFWFGLKNLDYEIINQPSHENRAPDHAILMNRKTSPNIQLEMTLLSWRNHFECDIYGEHGSAHIQSLCKWGPSEFIYRKRVLPSGYPVEEKITLTQSDPTWACELNYFQDLIKNKVISDLSHDLRIATIFKQYEQAIITESH